MSNALLTDWLAFWLTECWLTDWEMTGWLFYWLTQYLLSTDWLIDWLSTGWLTEYWLTYWVLTDWVLTDWLNEHCLSDWLLIYCEACSFAVYLLFIYIHSLQCRYWCMRDGSEDKNQGKLWKAASCRAQYVKSITKFCFCLLLCNISKVWTWDWFHFIS